MSVQRDNLNSSYSQRIQITDPWQFNWNCTLKIVGRKIPKDDHNSVMKVIRTN